MVAIVIALCSGGHVENEGKAMSIQEITYDASGQPRLGHCGSCVQRHTYGGPCPCNCHVLERLQAKEGKVGEKKLTPEEFALPIPDAYAYRYHDGIRFNHGQEVNGSKPSESLGLFYVGTVRAFAEAYAANALAHREEALGTCDTADWPHLHSDGSGHKRLHAKRESCTNWGNAAELLTTSALLLSDYSGELAKQGNTAKLEQVRNVIAELDVMTREMRRGSER